MAKKAANKSSKAMNKKGMKKTKGGFISFFKPATQAVEYSPRDPGSGNTISGNGISGNNTINGGTFTI